MERRSLLRAARRAKPSKDVQAGACDAPSTALGIDGASPGRGKPRTPKKKPPGLARWRFVP
jgi:hypothetical protein